MFTDKKFISHQFPGEYLDYLYYQPETDQPLPLLIYTPGAGCRVPACGKSEPAALFSR